MISDKEAIKRVREYEQNYKDHSQEYLLNEKNIIEGKVERLEARLLEIKKLNDQEYEGIDTQEKIKFLNGQVKLSRESIEILDEQFDLVCYSASIDNVLEKRHVENRLFTTTQAWIITISTVIVALCSFLDLILKLVGAK